MGIVSLMYRSRKLVICGRDLDWIRSEQVESGGVNILESRSNWGLWIDRGACQIRWFDVGEQCNCLEPSSSRMNGSPLRMLRDGFGVMARELVMSCTVGLGTVG